MISVCTYNDELCKTEMLVEMVLQQIAKLYSKNLRSISKKLKGNIKKPLYSA